MDLLCGTKRVGGTEAVQGKFNSARLQSAKERALVVNVYKMCVDWFVATRTCVPSTALQVHSVDNAPPDQQTPARATSTGKRFTRHSDSHGTAWIGCRRKIRYVKHLHKITQHPVSPTSVMLPAAEAEAVAVFDIVK